MNSAIATIEIEVLGYRVRLRCDGPRDWHCEVHDAENFNLEDATPPAMFNGVGTSGTEALFATIGSVRELAIAMGSLSIAAAEGAIEKAQAAFGTETAG